MAENLPPVRFSITIVAEQWDVHFDLFAGRGPHSRGRAGRLVLRPDEMEEFVRRLGGQDVIVERPSQDVPIPANIEPTVAGTLAEMIRERVPGWSASTPEPDLWRFEDSGRQVLVDGRLRELRVLPVMEGKHLGPSLIGFSCGVTVRVDLPGMTDRFDLRNAMGALIRIGVLPAENEGTDG